MTDDQPTSPPSPARRRKIYALAAGAGLILGLAGVYGIAATLRNAGGDPSCRAAVDLGQKNAQLMKGEVAALVPASAGLKIPNVQFQDKDGSDKTLADWHGRFVLLNLWATWCVPCRTEMPALDALQKKLGSQDFQVVALNIDTRDPDRPKAFLKDNGITSLAYFTDEKAKSFQALKSVGRALGMPTSVLIDPSGCEIATIAGPAEWASDDAVKLIRSVIGST
jgi:thiol-disulfide isomerase/thioredoxin